MKKIYFLTITLLILSFISCDKDNKDNTEELNGKITGYDMRKCMCCGGFYIDIKDSTYRFDSIPTNSGINLTIDTFPIKVNVAFHKKNPQCLGDEIIIDRMKKE
jgi:hypothetical protein